MGEREKGRDRKSRDKILLNIIKKQEKLPVETREQEENELFNQLRDQVQPIKAMDP